MRDGAIIIAPVILFASSIFIISGLFDKSFLFYGNWFGIKEMSPMVMVQNIPNSTLLTILSLLIAFAGILSWVFKEIVRKNLENNLNSKTEQVKEGMEKVRVASEPTP